MDFDLLYSLPSVLSTYGWTVPYLTFNVVGGDCGAVVIKKKRGFARKGYTPLFLRQKGAHLEND